MTYEPRHPGANPSSFAPLTVAFVPVHAPLRSFRIALQTHVEDSVDAPFPKKHESAALQYLVLFPCRYCTAATYHKLTRPGIWDQNEKTL